MDESDVSLQEQWQFKEFSGMERTDFQMSSRPSNIAGHDYNVHIPHSEFLRRYKDIVFLRHEEVVPCAENCERVLADAGIEDFDITNGHVILKTWQIPYLQDLAGSIHAETDECRQYTSSAISEHARESPAISEHTMESSAISGRIREFSAISGHSRKSSVISEHIRQFSDISGHTRESSAISRRTREYTDVTSESDALSDDRIYNTHSDNSKAYQCQVGGEITHQLPRQPGATDFVSDWMKHNETISPDPSARIYEPQMSQAEQKFKLRQEKKVLDPHWWDRFQMIPREQVSSSATFLRLFKVFKLFCYLFLFVVMVTAAVVNKVSLLLMTSSITKDMLPATQWPVKTMLIVSMCFPYTVWFLVYTAKSLFGSNAWPSLSLLSLVLVSEFLHTLGLCLLVFRVLPMIDMIRGFIILGSVYIIPALLKTITECFDQNTKTTHRCVLLFLNSGALLIQLGSVFACGIFNITMTTEEKMALRQHVLEDNELVMVSRPVLSNSEFSITWELPVAVILVSSVFWENFIDGDLSVFGCTIRFSNLKKHLHHARPRLYVFASAWKILWVVAFSVLLQSDFSFNLSYSNTDINVNKTVDSINNITQSRTHHGNIHELFGRGATNVSLLSGNETLSSNPASAFRLSATTIEHIHNYGVVYINILSSTILTYFGSTACKMCMQLVGFSLPLILATPLGIAVGMLQCMYGFLPIGRLVWIGVAEDDNVWILLTGWIGALWLSQLFITSHIWFPTNGRMEKNDRLFVSPIKCGILTEQSLILRRRRNDHDTSLSSEDESCSNLHDPEAYRADDVVPQIYACATMWHETRAEMTTVLKSVFRMDIDHSGRYLAQKFYKIRDPDYYEFEAHIFFDDAMELSEDDRLVPNMFISDLMDCMDDSLSSVHERQMSLGAPTRSPTPYGGRLTWNLPGGTKLIAHLKDKHKIRHKKRWSQVMYMYYLLGYRIFAQPENVVKKDLRNGGKSDGNLQRVKLTDSQLRRRRKAAHFTRSVIFNYIPDDIHTQADNTYILTLDGDVDFHPDSVRLLVDRLKKNKKVGAACGRIHPVGSGPLLWYQQFEYAIGHWLQKATEDVFGCVMCAPGCFSLFRGSALMDDNVARTYATRTTEAGHYVQYDQGEDRWLSTLLLQQGYRIDYCAAADALTHAPETFSEFFNQRRRWGPSTLANVIDLLGSWKGTIKINDNISTLYILYQFCLMVSTILGPATIILMMAGAFTVVFKTGVMMSYALAIVPAIAFILVCIYGKSSSQMTIASIMSAVYAIVMTIVLVGTVGQAIEGGFTSPNVVFLVMLVFIFFVSAIMHPEEFFCVIPGALYFICLPTGYLLLTIYYLCNMHVVSWGTREVPQRKTKAEIAAEMKIEEDKMRNKAEKKKSILGWIGLNSFFKEMGDMVNQLKTDTTKSSKSRTDDLLEQLIIEMRASRLNPTNITPLTEPLSESAVVSQSEGRTSNTFTKLNDIDQEEIATEREEDTAVPTWLKLEDYNNPAWLHSSTCGDGPIRRLPERENIFWKQMISKYLHPINDDKTHQEKVASDLKNLRNNVVFGFFMTSALWIALSMQLQLLQEELKDNLFFKIPRLEVNTDLAFEPLGLIFLAFFAMILCVQFLGMFVHRWGTVLHMLSIRPTEIPCGKTLTERDLAPYSRKLK